MRGAPKKRGDHGRKVLRLAGAQQPTGSGGLLAAAGGRGQEKKVVAGVRTDHPKPRERGYAESPGLVRESPKIGKPVDELTRVETGGRGGRGLFGTVFPGLRLAHWRWALA